MNTNVSTDEKRRRIKHGYSCAVKYFESDEFQEPTESESNQIGESTSPIELTEEEKEEDEEEEDDEKEENKNLPTQEEIVEKVMSVNYIV